MIPEDFELIIKPSIEALFRGQPYVNCEYRFRHPDGSIHWIQETATARPEAAENCWIFTTVAVDISDRKQLELALATREAQFKQAQAMARLGSWEFEVASERLFWSEAIYQIHEVDPNNYPIAPPITPDSIYPDDLDIYEHQILRSIQQGIPFAADLRIITHKGSMRHIETRGEPVFDESGTLQRFFGTILDITDRKTTEATLRQREEEFRTLVENSPDGILRVNSAFQVMYINPTAERKMGVAKAACLGKSFVELGLPANLAAVWQRAIAQAFESGQEQQLETQETLPFSAYTFHSRIVPERDSDGQIASVLIVSRDITNLKQAQTALLRRVNQEHSLRMITQHIRETLDLDAILSTAVNEVQRSLNADRTLIFQLTSDRTGIVIQESGRPEYPAILALRWEDECFPAECYDFYRRGQGRIVPDVLRDDWGECLVDFMQEISVQSKMVVPITQFQEDGSAVVWGLIITHACGYRRQWQPDELDLLQQVANQLAIAIQQSELHQQLQAANQELERLSNTDALTQIANRRRFDDTLVKEWQRAQREQVEISLILCDIDHFKRYNDTYGHPAGDACLITVANTLQQCLNRSTDCLARYGGEEFAIILPHTHLHGAIVVVEKMQAAIATLNLEHRSHPTASRITLSFGIAATTPRPNSYLQELLIRADRALYQAKETGRDQYVAIMEPAF